MFLFIFLNTLKVWSKQECLKRKAIQFWILYFKVRINELRKSREEQHEEKAEKASEVVKVKLGGVINLKKKKFLKRV